MPTEKRSLSEKLESIKSSVQRLPAAAASLNSASDDLAKSVNDLDVVLKKFSLGVPAWVTFESRGLEPSYYTEDIGYAKIGGRWGIAVRTVEGDLRADEEKVEQWLFNDAPRLLRVRAVDRIPELLEELLKRAAETAASIAEKANDVRTVTAAVSSVLEETARGISAAAAMRGTPVPEQKAPRVPLNVPASTTSGAALMRGARTRNLPEGK